MIKSRRMRWVGHAACMGEMRYAYNILVGIPKGKRSVGGSRGRRVEDIRMDLGKLGVKMWIGFI